MKYIWQEEPPLALEKKTWEDKMINIFLDQIRILWPYHFSHTKTSVSGLFCAWRPRPGVRSQRSWSLWLCCPSPWSALSRCRPRWWAALPTGARCSWWPARKNIKMLSEEKNVRTALWKTNLADVVLIKKSFRGNLQKKNRLDGIGNSIEDCRSWKDWTYGQFYASALIIEKEEMRQLLKGWQRLIIT